MQERGVKIMSEQTADNYVVKINTALGNHPFFVKIADPNLTIDRIFSEAIATLRNSGKPLESQQLEQLFTAHQLFNGGKVVQKGSLFSELERTVQNVGTQRVVMSEIDLVSAHSGGIRITTPTIKCTCGIVFNNPIYGRDVTEDQRQRLLYGDESIQEIVPRWSPEKREKVISGMCSACQKAFFG